MAFKFENLRVWQKALDLNDDIYKITLSFPKEELYTITAQLKRASDSVVLNIAEGSTGRTNKVFVNHLNVALGSIMEVVAAIFITHRRKYLTNEQFNFFYNEYEALSKMISSLRDSLEGEQ